MSYAGDITPEASWKLLSENPEAVLVDCRTDAEWRWVGVPDLTSLNRAVIPVEWSRSNGQRNENFVADLIAAGITPGDRPVVFLCRSGNRSIPCCGGGNRGRHCTFVQHARRVWKVSSTRTAIAAAPAGALPACRGSRHDQPRDGPG